MENPKQIMYAAEELFRLKPEAVNADIVVPKSSFVANDMHSVGGVIPANKPNFWGTYKWPITTLCVMVIWFMVFDYLEKRDKKMQIKK
jgi:hypothetical protein